MHLQSPCWGGRDKRIMRVTGSQAGPLVKFQASKRLKKKKTKVDETYGVAKAVFWPLHARCAPAHTKAERGVGGKWFWQWQLLVGGVDACSAKGWSPVL